MKEIQKRYPIGLCHIICFVCHISTRIYPVFCHKLADTAQIDECAVHPIPRFKIEHTSRTSAENELAQLREQRSGLEQQVWGIDDGAVGSGRDEHNI